MLLSDCPINPYSTRESVLPLAQALQHNHTITNLDLANNGMYDVGRSKKYHPFSLGALHSFMHICSSH